MDDSSVSASVSKPDDESGKSAFAQFDAASAGEASTEARDPQRNDEDVATFVAATVYIVTATLYSPKGRLIGRLERTWNGTGTIGDLCGLLVSNSQERPDLDHCRIDLRWRKNRSLVQD